MIEVCKCGGAICAHGNCVKCEGCLECGPHGSSYYQERVDDFFAERGNGDEDKL